MPDRPSPQDLLVHVMVVTAAADARMVEVELARIEDIVRSLPLFEGFDAGRLAEVSGRAVRLLDDENGLVRLLDDVAEVLPERLHETAYALAVEVAAADVVARQEELRFLQMLRERLDLDPLVTAAIERSARVRYRRA